MEFTGTIKFLSSKLKMEVQIQNSLVFYLLALVYLSVCYKGLRIIPCQASNLLNRSSFPADFVFGTGSSAYQYEGAAHIEGRKPSIWDTFIMDHPEKILDHSNGDVAIDFYFRYKEDIALMKEIGMDSFRFSISWSRILPNGKISGGVNQQGVAFYDSLIDHLISNGIEPFITLFHWDLPQALNDQYGGFLSPKIVKDFGDFVDFCFKQFGDRVKQWVTLNEPNLFTIGGYAAGTKAPGRCSNYIGNCTAGNSATEPYAVAHHLILCHATAVKLYREKYQASQKGLIGITLYTFWAVPKFQTQASRDAATRALDFMFGWFFNPITYGDYPKIMRELVGDRLPKFTESQSKMVKGSIDFLGFNYYTANYADDLTYYSNTNLSFTTDNRVNLTTEKHGIPIGQQTGASWLYLYPKGIQEILLYIKRKYNSPIIYITENGMADVDNSISRPIDNALNDSLRIKYHRLHLSYLLKAINKDGVDVRRYYVWSFLDNFEWSSGYTLRFGITYVDYKDGLKRYFKRSALWFRSFLQKQNNILSNTTSSFKLYSDR